MFPKQDLINTAITTPSLDEGLWSTLRAIKTTQAAQLRIKTELLSLVTRFGKDLGLRPHLKDHMLWLIGATFPQDWSEEAPFGPVVYRSVRSTARHFGITERALWKREQELISLGLIVLRSTSDRQRCGKRDAFDHLVYGFGVDLTPLLMKLPELIRLKEAVLDEDRAWQAACYELSGLKRQVRVGLDHLKQLGADPGRVEDLFAVYFSLPRIQAQSSIGSIRDSVDSMKLVLLEIDKMASALCGQTGVSFGDSSEASEPEFGGHTNLQNQIKASEEESSSDCGLMPSSDEDEEGGSVFAVAHTARGSAREPVRSVGAEQAQKTAEPVENSAETATSGIENCSLDIARLAAGPDFVSRLEEEEQGDLIDIRTGLWDWENLRRTAGEVRRDLLISDSTWSWVGRFMTPNEMAVSILIIDKKKVLIDEPGAYLRAMAERKTVGQLHLDRTLFGLADRERPVRGALL